MFENVEPIHSYSRAEAIRDGVLIDATATAREAGFRFPVALTRAVWERCVAIPPGVLCQDEAGRLWDVLTMLRFAIRGQDGGVASAFTSATTTARERRPWSGSRRSAGRTMTARLALPS